MFVVLRTAAQVNGYPTVFNTELAEYGNQSGALDEALTGSCGEHNKPAMTGHGNHSTETGDD